MFLRVIRDLFYYIFNKLHTHLWEANELFKKNDQDVSRGCSVWSYGQELVHVERFNNKQANLNTTQIFPILKSVCRLA